MAKKSASQAKIKKPEENFEPIEEVFEEAKKLFIMTVETQIKTAERIDNLLNIRDLAYNFYHGEGSWNDLDELKRLQDISVMAYKKVLEASKEFSLDEFRKPEIKDYYADLIPSVDDIENDGDLLDAVIIFLSIQPYGNKLVQMHQLIQQELAKRGEL